MSSMIKTTKTTKKAAAAAGDAKMLKTVTMVLLLLEGIRSEAADGKWIVLYINVPVGTLNTDLSYIFKINKTARVVTNILTFQLCTTIMFTLKFHL